MIDRDQIAEINKGDEAALRADVEHLSESALRRGGASADEVVGALVDFSVAAPSWAVGTGGTRFGRFPIGGEPEDHRGEDR